MNDKAGIRIKRRFFKALILVTALGGLFFLLRHIGWEEVLAYSDRLGWTGLCFLLFFASAESGMDAEALRLATQKQAGFFSCLAVNCTGGLVNRVIPLEAGEILKIGLLSQITASRNAVSGIILWNYIFKLSKPTATLTAAFVAILLGHIPNRELLWVIMGAALLAYLPFIGLHLIIRSRPASTTIKLLSRMRLLRRESEDLRTHDARFIDKTVRQFRKRNLPLFVKIFLWQYFARLMDWLSLYVALNMMDPVRPYSFVLCGFIYVGFNILSYILMILPTKIGTSEGGGYMLFSLYGLNPGLGTMVQLIAGLAKVLVNLIPALFLFPVSLRSKNSEDRA